MEQEMEQIRKQFDTEIASIKSSSQLELLSTQYLGRKGKINQLLSNLKNQPKDQIRQLGQQINSLKQYFEKEIADREKKLHSTDSADRIIDPTLPGKNYPLGSLHIVSTAIEEITGIFGKIGFIRMSYPEVDWEWGAFESLNMPADHPARDDVETSFIDFPSDPKLGKMVLTPHTSNGQNREMKRIGAPIRMINISKCYRPNWDATHTPMFFQFEGLCVDKNITIVNLKGTLDYFAKKYFGPETKTRLRPHHFQFTEPSFEVDITCTVCKGTGFVQYSNEAMDQSLRCKVCKSGWLELGGTGMVHPNVLTVGGIDPIQYSGWAFGFGIERVIMMKYGLDDIRNYYSGDIRFLEQF